MIFTTNRLDIRPIKDFEYPELLKIYCVENNMKYILDGKFDWTLEGLKQKWAKEETKGNIFCVVVHRTGQKIIGEALLLRTKEDPTIAMEVGYLLDEAYWNLGLGTELCEGLVKYGFESLGLKRLEAGLNKKNTRSSNLLKKLEFNLFKEGKISSGLEYEVYEKWNPHS